MTMSSHESGSNERRALLSGLGIAAVAGVALGSGSAEAAQKPGKFKPKFHDLDAWMEEIPGDHRVFIDTDSASGAANALRYATNILNAQANGYGGRDSDMAMIICLRHASTTLGFVDAMWAKYGSGLGALGGGGGGGGRAGGPGGAANAAPTQNAQTAALAAAAGRGVHFAICDAATTLMSGMLARTAGKSAQEVHDELVANKIANAHMVPAGVMALTRAQEHGYSFLYSAA
jgi:intracellular sulfur oxidation DsrE/DsrF family protein